MGGMRAVVATQVVKGVAGGCTGGGGGSLRDGGDWRVM